MCLCMRICISVCVCVYVRVYVCVYVYVYIQSAGAGPKERIHFFGLKQNLPGLNHFKIDTQSIPRSYTRGPRETTRPSRDKIYRDLIITKSIPNRYPIRTPRGPGRPRGHPGILGEGGRRENASSVHFGKSNCKSIFGGRGLQKVFKKYD